MPPTADPTLPPRRAEPRRMPASAPLAGLLILAPLALGGTRPAIQVTLAGLAALAVFVSAGRMRAKLPIWLLIPLAIAGWGLLQCAPVPALLRPFDGPLAGGQSGWAPISRDVPATLIATLHQAAFALVALAAYGAGPRSRRLIARALVGGAGLVAAIGLIHWAAGTPRIFGLFTPLDRPGLAGYFSVFVNANTAAGYLVLGAGVALGRFAGARGEVGRRRAAALGALAAGGAVLSGSRGGQAALVLTALVFGLLAFAHRGRIGEETARRTRAAAVGAAIIALAGITAAVLLLPDWGADPRLDGRLRTWAESLPLLGEVWPVGIGRGAFATVFPVMQQTPLDGTVTHPETIGLQLAIEWGVPAALAALVAGIGAWIVIFRRGRTRFDPAGWGLVAGLAGVGAQQLVDFGFEAMGLSLPVAAALGLALGPAETPTEPPAARSRLIPLAALALLLLAAIGGSWALGHTADADVARINDARDHPAIEAAADHALAHHPTDALAPLTAAARLAGSDPPAPLRLILARLNQSFVRAPADHRPHLLAARLLRQQAPSQAAVEYRLAIERAPWRALSLVREAATLTDPLDLAQAVPPDQRSRLGEVLLAAGRPADARAAMQAILLIEPAEADAHRLRARACLALRDRPCIEGEINWLRAHEPAAGHGLQARLDLHDRRPDAARASAEAALRAAPDDPATLRLAAEVAGARGDLPAARRHYTALFRRVGAQPARAAAVLAGWGRLERRAGDPEQGQRMLDRAAGLDPQYAAEAAAAPTRETNP